MSDITRIPARVKQGTPQPAEGLLPLVYEELRKDDERLLAVDEALEKFAAIDPRKGELVKLRYFTGVGFEEPASVLGIALPTAKEWWAYARAWLAVEMRQSI